MNLRGNIKILLVIVLMTVNASASISDKLMVERIKQLEKIRIAIENSIDKIKNSLVKERLNKKAREIELKVKGLNKDIKSEEVSKNNKKISVKETSIYRGIEEAYCYPNPAVKHDINIRVISGIADSIEIELYDINGSHIRHIDISGEPQVSGNKTYYETKVPASILSSGIYIVKIKVKKGERTDSKVLKCAVIR